MKTKEELNALKAEVDALNQKLAELTEDELDQVVGGVGMTRKRKYWYNAGTNANARNDAQTNMVD